MSIKKQWFWYIGVGLLFTANGVSANNGRPGYIYMNSCERTNQPAYRVDMRLGKIVVDPNLPVGSVIKTQDYSMNTNQTYLWCRGKVNIEAEVVMPDLRDIGGKVYQTNVEGIGLKFHRSSGRQYSMTYPSTFPLNVGNYETRVTLNDSVFTLSLIKTAKYTGTGTLASGIYTTYGYKPNNNPYLVSYLDANAITIVSPSCQVTSGENQNVMLDPIKRVQLTAKDQPAGEKDFNIKLKCSGGTSFTGKTNIDVTFSGIKATGTQVNGVLANQSTYSPAKGIGVQVIERRDKSPINFGRPYRVASLNNNDTKDIDIELTARYFQYEERTSPGEVYAQMRFDITYD